MPATSEYAILVVLTIATLGFNRHFADYRSGSRGEKIVPLLKTYRLRTPTIQLNMSYDLWFWRQTKPSDLSLDQICDQLAEDNLIDGIATLPIADIKAAVRTEFPGIEDELTSMTWEGNDSYFQVGWPVYATHVSVSCGYKLLDNPEPLNRLIDVMASFGCALYDPQTGERYAQPDLPEPKCWLVKSGNNPMHASCGSRVFQWPNHSPQPRDWCRSSLEKHIDTNSETN